jgi:hypothetical protein
MTKSQQRAEKIKSETYPAARAAAQAEANKYGQDQGLEWNDIFHTWRHFGLPMRKHRFGFELRVEVVSCEDLARCQPGHGPGHLECGWAGT